MKKARKTKSAPGGRKKTKKTGRKTSAKRKPIMRHSKEG
jgi:hypothetical protein